MPISTEEGYNTIRRWPSWLAPRQAKPGPQRLEMYFGAPRNPSVHPQHADCALPPALPSVSRVLCAGVSSPGASSTCARHGAPVNNTFMQRVRDLTAAWWGPRARHQHLGGARARPSMELRDGAKVRSESPIGPTNPRQRKREH